MFNYPENPKELYYSNRHFSGAMLVSRSVRYFLGSISIFSGENRRRIGAIFDSLKNKPKKLQFEMIETTTLIFYHKYVFSVSTLLTDFLYIAFNIYLYKPEKNG